MVLQNSVSPGTLVSRVDIRKISPDKKGKVSDRAVVGGTMAALAECEAPRSRERSRLPEHTATQGGFAWSTVVSDTRACSYPP